MSSSCNASATFARPHGAPRRAAWFTALLALLAASFALAPPAEAAFPGANGKLAFASNRDGNHEVYVMNADGTGQTNLTQNAASDTEPAWSPDGQRLAFTSDRDGNDEVYVMNADGTGQARLTHNAASDSHPAWSPDGQRLAFARGTLDGSGEIYVMNADGTGQTNLTQNAGSEDGLPAWSPDGQRLAFARGTLDGSVPSWEIYVMNADGTGQTNLTQNAAAVDLYPAWSPDGQRLAFASFLRDDGNSGEVYVMNADGTGQTNLTQNAAEDNDPAWSPDGHKLAFARVTGGIIDANYEVYVMNADGTGQTNLTQNAAGSDVWPAWQTLPSADLALSLGASPDVVRSGKQLTYTITVRNLGPSNALGAVVTDTLPPQARFVSATASQGAGCTTPPVGQTGTLSCRLGFVPNASSRNTTIVVKVVAPKKSTITNTASVAADTADPNSTNNSASISTPVR